MVLGVGGVPLLAFLDGVLGLLVHGKIQETQLKLTGEIGDGANILEHFPQTLFQEPLIGVLLDLEHIGHFQDLFVLCVALTHGLAKQLVLDHCHMDHHSLSFGDKPEYCVVDYDTLGGVGGFFLVPLDNSALLC